MSDETDEYLRTQVPVERPWFPPFTGIPESNETMTEESEIDG